VFSSDFWLGQMASALKAWAVLIPFILAFCAPFKVRIAKLKKENRKLRTRTDVVESRLKLASELNTGDAKAIAQIQTKIAGLRRQIKKGTQSNVVEPIVKEADSSATAMMMANTTINHILTAEKIAISGTRARLRGHAHSESASSIFVLFLFVVAATFSIILVLVAFGAD